MAMGTKPLFNILMNFGPMILISRLGNFCICFITLKRNKLRNHRFCLSLSPKTHFFNKFCKEDLVVLNALKLANKIIGVKPLRRKLLLQMDNYVKDNKNCHLLTFLSLLIVWEVFKEI
jgi:hypothetical protein